MTPKKKEKRAKKKEKQRDAVNQPVGADIAPDYVAEDLTGYRVPYEEK